MEMCRYHLSFSTKRTVYLSSVFTGRKWNHHYYKCICIRFWHPHHLIQLALGFWCTWLLVLFAWRSMQPGGKLDMCLGATALVWIFMVLKTSSEQIVGRDESSVGINMTFGSSKIHFLLQHGDFLSSKHLTIPAASIVTHELPTHHSHELNHDRARHASSNTKNPPTCIKLIMLVFQLPTPFSI